MIGPSTTCVPTLSCTGIATTQGPCAAAVCCCRVVLCVWWLSRSGAGAPCVVVVSERSGAGTPHSGNRSCRCFGRFCLGKRCGGFGVHLGCGGAHALSACQIQKKVSGCGVREGWRGSLLGLCPVWIVAPRRVVVLVKVSCLGLVGLCCVVLRTSADALVLVGVVWLSSQHRQTLKFNFIDGIGKLKETYIAREMKALKQNRDAVRELVSAQRWCGGSARCGCDADGSFAAAFARVRYGAPELPVASAFQAEPRRHAQWLRWG